MTTKPDDGVTGFARRIADRGVIDGGPAHPFIIKDDDAVIAHTGMSLRDWFAGQALIAISGLWRGTISDIDESISQLTARVAYQIADAMLAERSK